MVRAREAMQDPDGPIPRGAPIPFHVAVEGEQLAVLVEREVVGVALPGREQLRARTVRLHPEDVATRRLAPASKPAPVLHPRQHDVVGLVAHGRRRGHACGDFH